MARTSRLAFDSIESAHEYIGLLCEVVDEAEQAIAQEIAAPSPLTNTRHVDAMRLVDYKLKALRQHFVTSRRLLTDLRTLRRYILDERATDALDQVPAKPAEFDLPAPS